MKAKHNYEQKAYYIWEILIERLNKNLDINKVLITYQELGEMENVNLHHRVIKYALGLIYQYCYENNIPILTLLVVRQDTKKPGWDVLDSSPKTLVKMQEFYKNNKIPNPFDYAKDGDGGALQSEIVKAILDSVKKGNIKEVYTKYFIKGRSHQGLFRDALLKIYGLQCAFCGLTFKDALEACHIVPYSKSNDEQKIDPKNGILLCATHHKLFDKNQFIIDEKYNIEFNGNKSDCARNADKNIINVEKIKYDKKHKDRLPSIENVKQRKILNNLYYGCDIS